MGRPASIVVASHHRATRFVWDSNSVDMCERAEADLGAQIVAPDRRAGRIPFAVDQAMSLGLHLLNAAGPLIAPVEIPRCDVFIYMASLPMDIAHLQRMRGWKNAGVKIIFLPEMWSHHVTRFSRLADYLKAFDVVFTSMPALPGRLQALIGKPVHYLVRCVDVLALAPRSLHVQRPIDVYAMGRRPPALHEQFLAAMEREDIHYMYDSFDGGVGWVKDAVGYRRQMRAFLKRSKFIPVFGVRAFDHVKKTDAAGGEHIVVLRYFEAAAAGCAMFGDPCEEVFPFEAVLPVAPDCPNVLDRLWGAWADGEAQTARRRAVLTHALRNFDFAHRFATVFDTVGVARPETLERRLRLLEDRAREIEAEPAAATASARTL